ncbi:uncharacterized protein LOC130446752 isoform X2 [Diorhabda sublineata]|uniref:uncharacterized protein LOC130446752 isoform X2 n=1 Tax=Diorhabda sublineata TaxID=1163346 RepID=UPI0024E12D15|nr:uncharacterized protein LOC130446752 isoform X2 [Diorhabda sublineata]
MGKKKKGKNNKIDISVVEKAPVGFDAFIPEVTIILTESSMNLTKLQKIVDQYRPFYYHKFSILNAETYSKSYILNAISEFVKPSTVRPIYYNKNGSTVYFLANNCLKVIMKIISNKFKVPHSTDTAKEFELAIYENCMAPEDVPHIDTDKNINQVLIRLYDRNLCCLNLSNFVNNDDLIEYCPLTDKQIFKQVMKQAAVLKPNEVNLSQNSIKDTFSIHYLEDTLMVLDISSNNLESMSSLNALQGFTKLKVLNLTDNPLCQNYDSFNYVMDVKKYCPSLQILDGKNIVIPDFVKNFVCTPDAQYLATQFLEHFFTIYDSSDRIDLVHLYHTHAIFSVTSRTIPHQSNSKMVKLGHYGSKNPYAVYGIEEIMKLFQEFPKSYHDPYPMVCDVTLFDNTNAHLVVTGIFREFKQILSFCRSFYFRHSNNEFKIINEQLHVSNALDYQMGWSFSFPVDMKYFGNPLPYYKEEFRQFETAMQKLTNMNLEYCQKYLVYCNYDLKKALTLFSELYITNDVPKEAFEIEKSKSSNNLDTGICEALKEKVLQRHGSISSKTIWDTLNNDRIDNENYPPISINKSILRMYKKPEILVNYEDYPILQDSTDVKQNFRDYFSKKLQTSRQSFQSREEETNKNGKTPRPTSSDLPQPSKPLDVSVSKTSHANSLLDLANKIARNKEFVAMQLKKMNESTQQMPQSSSALSFAPPDSQQLSTIPVRTPQTRPTAATFFNSSKSSCINFPGTSDYMTEVKKPRVSQLVNIPLVPKTNLISKPTHDKIVNNSDSADETQNNVPVDVPVTETLNTDTITKLRENLQVDKDRLCEIESVDDKNETNSSEKKIILDSKKTDDFSESANSNNKKSPSKIDTPNKTRKFPKDKMGTDDKQSRPIIERPGIETSIKDNNIRRITTITNKHTEKVKCGESGSTPENEVTVVVKDDEKFTGEIETKTTTEKISHPEGCQRDTNLEVDNNTNKQDELDETNTVKLPDLSSPSKELTVSTFLKPQKNPDEKKRGQKRKLTSDKTKVEYPEYSQNLIVRLCNLSASKLKSDILESSSSQVVVQRSDNIDAPVNSLDSNGIHKNDSSNEELMDTLEEIQPVVIPQNKPKLTLLKSSDMKLKLKSSDVDRCEPEGTEFEDDKTINEIADSKNKRKNIVVNITRMVINTNEMIESPSTGQKRDPEVVSITPAKTKPAIKKESPTSSVDNVEGDKSIATDAKKENEECNKVKRAEEKMESDQNIVQENVEKNDLKSKIKLESMFKLDENDEDDDVPLIFLNIESDNDD